MIRATELAGRAVIDLDAAEKLGKVQKVILDPDARRVAGFVVSRGSSLFGEGTHITVPASRVYAVGPDAITLRQDLAGQEDTAMLDSLPRVSDLIGRKVVSRNGRFLGDVRDVLINDGTGQIVGYLLADEHPMARLEELVSGAKKTRPSVYLRADADLRAGRELIVAPEDAVNDEREAGEVTAAPSLDVANVCHWADPTGLTTPTGEWVRRDRPN